MRKLKVMELNPTPDRKPDDYALKYEKLGSEPLISQLRNNDELPKGTVFRVDLAQLVHPIYLRAGTSDLWVFDQIFLYCELETDFGEDLGRIIDAGANIGLASVYLANRFPNAQILALEVDAQNFELSVKNPRAYPQIMPLPKGLWNHRAKLAIDNPQDDAWAYTVSETDDETHSAINGVGVADLLRDFGWQRVDVLKMDIEGAELEVLSAGTEEWIDCIGVLAIEVHYQRVGCWEAFARIAEQSSFVLKWFGKR